MIKYTDKELRKHGFAPRGKTKKALALFSLPITITNTEFQKIPKETQDKYTIDESLFEAFDVIIYELKKENI